MEAAISKLVIIGTIDVVRGKRRQVLAALAAHKARCLQDEPGSLEFEIMTPHDDETRVLVYEVYRDNAAFEVHRTNPSIEHFLEESAGAVAAIHITRCTPLV
jgi:quinol monooxygenase YgiN